MTRVRVSQACDRLSDADRDPWRDPPRARRAADPGDFQDLGLGLRVDATPAASTSVTVRAAPACRGHVLDRVRADTPQDRQALERTLAAAFVRQGTGDGAGDGREPNPHTRTDRRTSIHRTRRSRPRLSTTLLPGHPTARFPTVAKRARSVPSISLHPRQALKATPGIHLRRVRQYGAAYAEIHRRKRVRRAHGGVRTACAPAGPHARPRR